ncbi:MAG: Wzz/FepE/Etk N-terminal domain-containing protein [Tissierellia bacterium]|nr:Wzz/FepE/Etk N-terminal domain-containing protein [Tissierellia bacterium]
MNTIRSLRKNLYTIVIFVLILGVLGFLYAKFLKPDSYKAEAKIYAESVEQMKGDSAKTFAETVNTNSLKKQVIENLSLNMSIKELDKLVSIKAVENSQTVRITTVDTIELRASDISDEIADLGVKKLNDLYKNNARVIDYSYQNTSKVSNARIIYISMLIGLIIALLFNYFTDVSDQKIHSIDQLTDKYNILADIPRFEAGDLNDIEEN